MDKKEERKLLQAKRNALTEEEVSANSELIAKNILESQLYKQADIIMGYLAFGKEASIDLVLQQALAGGKIVCVPQVVYGLDFMRPVRLRQMDNLTLDKFFIRTPMEPCEIISPQILNLVLVPGVGFTKRGARIGMGKGYYDRFLPQATQAATMGVAQVVQVVDKISTDEYDINMQYLVTEKSLIACK
jgi:5-formyltetrahydrofolate cyclo-ligase